MDSTPLVKVNNLSFSYPDANPIFKNFDLTIQSGEFIALLGSNGSGKSTLSRVIIGLVDEENITEGNVEKNGKISMVFQNPERQFVGATVEDDIAFGLENLKIPTEQMPQIINQALKMVDMQDYKQRPVENLSGGQQQRVAVASTIVLNPNLIIFDEATSMLDPDGRSRILELIKQLQIDNPKLAIIMITHNMDEAAQTDRTIILNDGEIVADGKTKTILNDINLLEQNNLQLTTVNQFKTELIKVGIDLPLKIQESNSIEEISAWLSDLNK